MDGYLIKSDKEGEGTVMDANAAATLQQMLANSGVLMSIPQLLQSAGGTVTDGNASTASGSGGGSLPWMPYQMVVLPQSLLAAQNISQDGQFILAPSTSVADGQTVKADHVSSVLDQAVAALLQKQDNKSLGAANLSHLIKDGSRESSDMKVQKMEAEHGIKPPKKPLTPYMTFSKMVIVYFLFLHH